ncbi:uncharacterized protein LOC126837191 [Adelges cooleyi]|uniref:uncharacterized protein LOC126837191 n=1 Tax=Adelges cooleyi TaxID=133065 RepID=UPI00217F45B7|nr:uncharacterized protein LOC126837191 [Adelges cooleyi]
MWFMNAVQAKLSAAIILMDIVLLYHPVGGGNILWSSRRSDQEYNELMMIHTGYEGELPTEISIRDEKLVESTRRNKQKDLKCTYVLSGLYHVRLTGLLLKHFENTDTAVKKITSYDTTVQTQMDTLLKFGAEEMKTMWSFYLYINLLSEYPECFAGDGRTESEFKERAIKAHALISDQMEHGVQSCRKNNRFDGKLPIEEKECMDLMEDNPLGCFNEITRHVKTNIWSINHMMELNRGSETLRYTSDQSISLRSLYLNDFGSSRDVRYLSIAYNVQVVWNDIAKRLKAALKRARSLEDLLADQLRPLIEYQTMCVDFVKIMMLKLTLKHLEYMRQMVIAVRSDTLMAVMLKKNKIGYVEQWLEILTEFAMIFDLTEDRTFEYLLSNFHVNTADLYDEVQSQMVVSNIQLELGRLSNALGVSATSPIVLDGKEFTSTYYTYYSTLILPNFLYPSTVPKIQINSIYCSKTFVQHMRTLFGNVDFTVVRTLSEPLSNHSIV